MCGRQLSSLRRWLAYPLCWRRECSVAYDELVL
jgi:hypothetical protein